MLTVGDVFTTLFRHPGRMLVGRWHWKSAIASSLIRANIFLATNWSAGPEAAAGAMVAEFVYRFLAAGFYGALTQSFRRAEPPWAALLTVSLLLPAVSHSVELLLHWLRGTPNLRVSILASVCFTGATTVFNWYAMRRGVLLVGEGHASFWGDLCRVPGILVDLFRDAVRFTRRLPLRNPS
jgi:hypothetical protein